MIIKCLSIKGEWAELINKDLKTIETRVWKTKYRGWILLHASKLPKTKLSGKAFAFAYLSDCRAIKCRRCKSRNLWLIRKINIRR